MTIYAKVNGLLSPERSNMSIPVWTIISPAAILQGGNPFFVPDFASCFEAHTALAVRIGKLGKGISPRFVGRYIESAAPAILFVASDLLKSLREKGLPWSQAISYDRALALGKFTSCSLEECKKCEISLSLESAGANVIEQRTPESLHIDVEETIAAISRDNALKMGDIILFGISAEGPQVHSDIRAHLRMNGGDSLAFNIR